MAKPAAAATSSPPEDGPDHPVGAPPAVAKPAAAAGVSTSGGGGSFGAVGRSGVRDLGRAFTQAIPPACDSDPLWGKTALGSIGAIKIAIDIDEAGRIGGWKPLDDDPPPPKALVSLARRTVAMLQAGTFSLRAGAVTAGRQTLQISAVTSDVEPPEGKTITLAQDFNGEVGKAAFTQASGRHVELKIRVTRVEVFAASP